MKKLNIKYPRSLKTKFIFMNIAIFLVILSGFSALKYYIKDTDSHINNYNSAFVEIDKYVSTKNQASLDYLNKVARLHNVMIAIVNEEGNILLKSNNVKENKIDMQRIEEVFKNQYKDGNFYQLYNITIDKNSEKLLIWDKQSLANRYNLSIYAMALIVLISMLLMYLMINSKVKYIKIISNGAQEFSEGNLDYRIEKRGKDELEFLAQSMNSMAMKLKENIEKERIQEKFKTELITNVSHDLRTPLTSIIAYLQLLNSGKTSEEDKSKYNDICLKKSYKLKELIDDLFEYSKLESGGIALEKNNINIVEILEQSIGELFIEAKDKNMHIKKNFPISNLILNVDSMKIGRVFENLLSNAVKYGVEGTYIVIELKEESKYVNIIITNTVSEEIFEEDMNNIFQKFYRGDKARNSRAGGSGLGLAIAKDIIELHGGKINAKCSNNLFNINIKLKKDN
ncbi:MAG: HAMP domain-containing sensor histidine kinase [Clostridium sp.]|nr:HAMP domain-containing sensor histidine kinase [Clostridium sp.]